MLLSKSSIFQNLPWIESFWKQDEKTCHLYSPDSKQQQHWSNLVCAETPHCAYRCRRLGIYVIGRIHIWEKYDNAVFSHFKTLQHFLFNQGWNDVGFHGSNQIPTPNIDSLAWDGLVLHTYHLLIIIIIIIILNAIRSGLEQLLCQPNLHSEQERLANWQTSHSYRWLRLWFFVVCRCLCLCLTDIPFIQVSPLLLLLSVTFCLCWDGWVFVFVGQTTRFLA